MLKTLQNWVHRQHEFQRVAIAAAIGTVLSWLTYEIVFFVNPLEPRATTSWAAAFLIGVFRQHHLHRTLSFYKSTRSYSGSLSREALAAVFVFVTGILLNYWLTDRLDFNHRIAWATCLVSVSAVEYALMKFFVFRSPTSVGPK